LTLAAFAIKFGMCRQIIIAILAVLLMATCAHKAPPIVKDRLNPKLAKITVINNRQIQLTFTEEIDTVTLFPDSIFIASGKETLKTLLMYPSLSAAEIVAATEPMRDINYEITGLVYDKAENKGLFKSSFQGSAVPDTIKPWITSYSEGRNRYEFYLQFSEAMDTTSESYAIIPRRNFRAEWMNHRYVKFVPASEDEFMNLDTTYYLFLKSARDISGNPSERFVTSVTPDTVYDSIDLAGKALIDTVRLEDGMALLVRDKIIGISLIMDGGFSFSVRDSLPHTITVVAGEYSGSITALPGSDNIVRLKKGRIDIDSIID
jgi:hypothetical protein